MLLVLDVGNTAVTYGIYHGERLLLFGSSTFNEFPKLLKKWSKSGFYFINNALISSVVPKNTEIIKRLLSSYLSSPSAEFPVRRGTARRAPTPSKKHANIFVIGENLRVPIKHRYRSIRQLGADRIVNIYGAIRFYRPPLLIIDYGTAVTFDYVSKRGVFEGGMIIPGPEISFQALIDRAALLPKKIRLPRRSSSFLGRSTFDCLKSGTLEGFGAMADGLVNRFKSEYGKKLRIISTGGFAEYLKPHTRSFDVLDPQHSIKSLFLIFQEFCQK